MDRYLNEVESIIRKIKPVKKPSKWKAENYVGAGQSKLKYLNIKIPLVRKTFQNGFSFYHLKNKKVDIDQSWRIFDFIWNQSEYFEVMLLSSYFVASLPIEEKIKKKKLLISWIAKVDNWAHSDEMSAHYSQMLEFDNSLLKVYDKWNRSKNPWERRQSLVGLLFYSRFRKKPLSWKRIKPFVDSLLDDEHYYVQKGVGWCLREAYNLYPKVVYSYLYSHVGNISAVAWVACTEKLNKIEKEKLLKRRKALRLKTKKRA